MYKFTAQCIGLLGVQPHLVKFIFKQIKIRRCKIIYPSFKLLLSLLLEAINSRKEIFKVLRTSSYGLVKPLSKFIPLFDNSVIKQLGFSRFMLGSVLSGVYAAKICYNFI